MKPLGWRMRANDEFYGKQMVNGSLCYCTWYERIVTARRGRLYDRRLVAEQLGASRPARMR